MAPLLSVVIPTYNRVDYLEQLLEKLQDETSAIPDGVVEVIVLDNASTDETADLADYFASRIKSFRYHCNETNIGAENSVFLTPKLAAGEWLWVFGDDDIVHDGTVARLVSLLQETLADFVLLNYSQSHRDGVTILTDRVIDIKSDLALPRLGQWLPYPGSSDLIAFISAVVCRRAVLDAVDPAPYRLNSYYGHMGRLFEAFGNRPTHLVAEPWLTQRQFNQRSASADEATILPEVNTGIALLRVLLEVQKRGVLPPEELWSMTARNAIGNGAGFILHLDWAINCLVQAPLVRSFGRLSDETAEQLRLFLSEDGMLLPPAARQRIQTLFTAAVEGCQARRTLVRG